MGRPRRGQAPTPVAERPDDQAQSYGTDPARHRLRTTNQGGESCGKAPASVEGAWQRIVAGDVPAAAHDQPQAEPLAQAPLAPLTPAGLERPQDEAGAAPALPAPVEKGSDSEAAVAAREP